MYKLIKEYPGSPEEGHVVKKYKEKNLKNYYYSISEDKNCNNLQMYHIDNLNRFPEFWEKIIILDHKLLSYIGSPTNRVNKNIIWDISDFDYEPGNHLIDNPAWIIYCVKRLKDNKIFKINDIVRHKKWNSIGKIRSFEMCLINFKLLKISIDWTIKNNVNDDSIAFINDIQHYKDK